MQNDDEEQGGLEKKLSCLQPRDMDESYVGELMESLERERNDQTGRRNEGAYPPNVLWVRFAPVAAAAGVVLLGTFFLRYESRMGEIQAQRSDLAPMNGLAIINDANKGRVGAGDSQPGSLPVPRLGVGESFGTTPFSAGAPGLLPVSAQNYLQPLGEAFGDLNKDTRPITSLHFEDAYDWQDVVEKGVEGEEQ